MEESSIHYRIKHKELNESCLHSRKPRRGDRRKKDSKWDARQITLVSKMIQIERFDYSRLGNAASSFFPFWGIQFL